jgi:hypothetical protein
MEVSRLLHKKMQSVDKLQFRGAFTPDQDYVSSQMQRRTQKQKLTYGRLLYKYLRIGKLVVMADDWLDYSFDALRGSFLSSVGLTFRILFPFFVRTLAWQTGIHQPLLLSGQCQ